jgi:putative photosynthetic complex assembly protein 2
MTLASPWIGVGITVFAWWLSTGLILILVRLPRAVHLPMLIGFAAVASVAAWGIMASANNSGPLGVYCGFACALVIWGWHEASFLMGFITGPRPHPCPPEATGIARFGYATATLIYHEIALFLTLVAISVATWPAPNQTALWTFGLLFAMRLSSKFNIFLGVPNLTEEFFPDHLDHLKSYLPKRSMNALMPFSIVGCLAGGVLIWQQLAHATTQEGTTLALTIALTLVGLGLLEHLFMITPLPDAALWRWAAPVRQADNAAKDVSRPRDHGDETRNENV